MDGVQCFLEKYLIAVKFTGVPVRPPDAFQPYGCLPFDICRACRKCERKNSTLAGMAFCPHHPTVGFYHLLDDGKTQAGAAFAACP